MADVTRRQVGAVFAGVAAGGGLAPAVAPMADDKAAEFDEKAERARVIAAGLTEAEADCWVAVAKAAGAFFALPKMHVMDEHEVAQAIHVVQNKLLGRPTYRRYLEAAKNQKK